MTEDELFDLSKSIKEGGLRFPIILHEGKILDGRNRYRACQMADVAPRFEDFTGTDPLQFAIDANRERRHDSPSQRAMAAAKLANIRHGSNQFKVETPDGVSSKAMISVPQAAVALGVGTSSVDRARRVIATGSPEIIEKVEDGSLTVTDPLQFAIDANRERRHDSPSQRAMAAAKLANIKRGGDRKSDAIKAPSGALISVPKVTAARSQLRPFPVPADSPPPQPRSGLPRNGCRRVSSRPSRDNP